MDHHSARRRLWWQWLAATATGWFLLMRLEQSAFVWVGPVLVAIGQWLVVRPILKRAGWWLIVTPIGFCAGIVVGGVSGGILQDAIDGVSSPLFGIHSVVPGRSVWAYLAGSGLADFCVGALLAGSQWLVLRADSDRALLWLSLSTGSIAAGVGVDELVIGSAFSGVSLVVLLGQLGGTSVISAGTGVALLRSLRPSNAILTPVGLNAT